MKESIQRIYHPTIILLFFIMSIFLFNYCKEEPTEPITKKYSVSKSLTNTQKDSLKISAIVTIDSTKDKNKDKGKGVIVPDAVICGTLDLSGWEFDRYQSTGGIMGILPNQSRLNDPTQIATLKNYWGFNYIHCAELDWNNVIAGGYSGSQEIMLGINPSDQYWQTVVLQKQSWAYYVDEPGTNYTSNAHLLMQIARNYINYYQPGAKFIGGDTSPSYADYFDDTVDDVLCTKYDGDQRWLWDNFKSVFPSKFTMTWISASSDQGEYDQLFEKANNLGLAGVWFYQSGDNSDSNLNNYIMAAWRKGWINKIERLYYYTYRCSKPNPCDCDRNNITDGWELEQTWRTDVTRAVPYN